MVAGRVVVFVVGAMTGLWLGRCCGVWVVVSPRQSTVARGTKAYVASSSNFGSFFWCLHIVFVVFYALSAATADELSAVSAATYPTEIRNLLSTKKQMYKCRPGLPLPYNNSKRRQRQQAARRQKTKRGNHIKAAAAPAAPSPPAAGKNGASVALTAAVINTGSYPPSSPNMIFSGPNAALSRSAMAVKSEGPSASYS